MASIQDVKGGVAACDHPPAALTMGNPPTCRRCRTVLLDVAWKPVEVHHG